RIYRHAIRAEAYPICYYDNAVVIAPVEPSAVGVEPHFGEPRPRRPVPQASAELVCECVANVGAVKVPGGDDCPVLGRWHAEQWLRVVASGRALEFDVVTLLRKVRGAGSSHLEFHRGGQLRQLTETREAVRSRNQHMQPAIAIDVVLDHRPEAMVVQDQHRHATRHIGCRVRTRGFNTYEVRGIDRAAPLACGGEYRRA